jgi:hypothetical protein
VDKNVMHIFVSELKRRLNFSISHSLTRPICIEYARALDETGFLGDIWKIDQIDQVDEKQRGSKK